MLDLCRASLFILGPVEGLSRRQLRTACSKAGVDLQSRLGPKVGVVAVTNAAARDLLSGERLMDVLERVPDQTVLISETALQRSLGLKPPETPVQRTLGAGELCRLSSLDEEYLFWLALFDIIEPLEGLHSYRDLLCAREVSRLMKAGAGFDAVVAAGLQLRRAGRRLCEVKLTVTRHGEVLRLMDGAVTMLDGQMSLAMETPPESVDDVLECAEEAEADGDFETAERLYDLALKLDPQDPLIAFNLGNVQDAAGRSAQARISWRLALERAPLFPEAWFNLGVAAEDAGRREEAVSHYMLALAVSETFSDAAYNLALLLHDLGRFSEALPVWERFIAMEPGSEDARVARRKAADCRFRVRGLSVAV